MHEFSVAAALSPQPSSQPSKKKTVTAAFVAAIKLTFKLSVAKTVVAVIARTNVPDFVAAIKPVLDLVELLAPGAVIPAEFCVVGAVVPAFVAAVEPALQLSAPGAVVPASVAVIPSLQLPSQSARQPSLSSAADAVVSAFLFVAAVAPDLAEGQPASSKLSSQLLIHLKVLEHTIQLCKCQFIFNTHFLFLLRISAL